MKRGFTMKPATIGWTFALNILAVASFELRPFKIYDWSYGKDVPPDVSPRIYMGMEAKDGQFKFMIFLLAKVGENVQFCSSSLVKASWVLTAAHCVDFPFLENVILIGGKANLVEYISERIVTPFDVPLNEETYGVQERWNKDIFVHPDYDKLRFEHDVALIRVNEPFVLGYMVSTIPLSTEKMTSRKQCTILGWGMLLGNQLPYKLHFIEGKEASTTEIGCLLNKKGRFICLKPDFRGICHGDSGSPIVCDGRVWGVASHVETRPENSGICGQSVEEFYTETYYDQKWILSYTNGGHDSRGIRFKSFLSFVVLSIWISTKI